MAVIEQIEVDLRWTVPEVWTQVAAALNKRLAEGGLSARDAVVLLPFAALLAPLRAAFAAAGGWQPRVETTLTLAASLTPPKPLKPGACCGDPAIDSLNAAVLLRRHRWGAELAKDDGNTFAHAVSLVVDAAQVLRAAAAARAPADRSSWWAQARQVANPLGAGSDAVATESRLLAVAAEWAAESCTEMHTDALFQFTPSVWMLVHLGGADALAEGAALASVAPAWRVMLDPPRDQVMAGLGPVATRAVVHANVQATTLPPVAGLLANAQRWLCADFEAEAMAAASLVIDAVSAGRTPVALVALDRALIRRVRALLARQGLPLIDETGWLLATTAAAAHVLALLRAAGALQNDAVTSDHVQEPVSMLGLSSAGRDHVLTWLKAMPSGRDDRGIDALEALWRGRRRGADKFAAAARWQGALEALSPLLQAHSQSLAKWVQALQHSLSICQALADLAQDAAGRQVLAALRLDDNRSAAWLHVADNAPVNLYGFVDWVSQTLEQTPYLPVPDDNAAVVLTPLARAFGRSFAQTVVPGADHQQLGRPTSEASLIGQRLARDLGMADAGQRHLQQRLALLHLLRAPQVSFTRRQRSGDEPMAEGPDLAWLFQALAPQGAGAATAWQPWQAAQKAVDAAPVLPPRALAAQGLLARLSASQLSAYRECPYRFFARAVLLLDEPDELDTSLAKRDYGDWIHAVLHRFHSQRDHRLPPAPQLLLAADWATEAQLLDASEMVPWRASFTHFCAPYLQWLADREAQGWFWADGETDLNGPPNALPGTLLRGRIDRLDHGPKGEQQVIDYKTSAKSALKAKVAQPLEDTQLAFYAALLGSPSGAHGDVQALYLALDEADGVAEVEHPNVEQTVQVMLPALAEEWQRMLNGEPLQALGEGPVCDTCEARGLCRRDHWAAPANGAVPQLDGDGALNADESPPW